MPARRLSASGRLLAAALTLILAQPVVALAEAPPEGRVYEQVTPVEKEGSLVGGRYMNALPDGSGLRYIVRGAPADAEGSPAQPRFVSLRDDSGWSRWVGADPPFRAPPWLIAFQTTLAVSDDGHHAFVVSNRALAPGGVDLADAANLYVKDLRTGSYAWVGTATGGDSLNSFIGSNSMDKYVGGGTDFDWVLFFSEQPLLPGVDGGALYRWTADAGLQVVSLLPGGEMPSVPVQEAAFWQVHRQASADGRRIFFGLEGSPVYLWENGTTAPVSISQLDGSARPAEFLDTDSTGRFVFFVSSEPLLADVPARSGTLYRYDLDTGALDLVGRLLANASERETHLLAISADGASAFFASSDGALVSWRSGPQGSVTQIVPGGYGGAGSEHISPGGSYLAFERSSDVYLYDAVTDRLSCASCLGGEATGEAELRFPFRAFDSSSGRAVDDQGRVFFTSSASLVPEDVNGVEDVYVFTPAGASLISPGTQATRAAYGDISEDGSDVFFATAAPLVATDRDDQADVYDARIGGGFPAGENREPPSCADSGCQPPAEPPPDPAIGSERNAPQAAPIKPRRCRKAKRRCVGKASKSKRGLRHGDAPRRGKRPDRSAG